MVPAFNLRQVKNELSYRFEKDNEIRMIGFLFSRPYSSLSKSQIIPNLDYYHHRSGKNIDFFCAGYGMYWESFRNEIPDQITVTTGRDINWLYSNEKFNLFRKEIETLTNWNYSGSSDLLLCNAYLQNKNDVRIDFSNIFVCDLEKMIADSVILSVERFFENIFKYADNPSETNPVSDFIVNKDIQGVKNIFIKIIDVLLKKTIGTETKGLKTNFIKDVSQKAI